MLVEHAWVLVPSLPVGAVDWIEVVRIVELRIWKSHIGTDTYEGQQAEKKNWPLIFIGLNGLETLLSRNCQAFRWWEQKVNTCVRSDCMDSWWRINRSSIIDHVVNKSLTHNRNKRHGTRTPKCSLERVSCITWIPSCIRISAVGADGCPVGLQNECQLKNRKVCWDETEQVQDTFFVHGEINLIADLWAELEEVQSLSG